LRRKRGGYLPDFVMRAVVRAPSRSAPAAGSAPLLDLCLGYVRHARA
jgi:hypothetical protein